MSKMTFPLVLGLLLCAPRAGLSADRAELLRQAARSGERIWAGAQAPPARMGSRDLYIYALALAQAKLNTERIETLLAVGAKIDRLFLTSDAKAQPQ